MERQLIWIECSGCGNDTFQPAVEELPSGVSRIAQIKCAECGDKIDFVTMREAVKEASDADHP